MIRATLKILFTIAVLCPAWIPCRVWASGNPDAFAFVNPNYVITAESAGEHTFIVNFINLSDFVIVVQPCDFIYRSAAGRHYIGQVYELDHKNTLGEMQKYSASILIRGHSYEGLNVVGLFREKDQIEELSIRIGAKRFYLQPMEQSRFEQLVRKIETLNLDSTSVTAMFEEANIQRTGTVESTDGTAEWDRDWEGLITPDGINPPKAIESPAIPLPEKKNTDKNKNPVRLSCLITRNGGIQNLKVVRGHDRELEQRALNGVANSWLFLPATKNGEVYETMIEFNVEFAPPDQNS